MPFLSCSSPVDIEFVDLNYSVPNGKNKDSKVILKNISGKFRSGRLTAIMGPSGAGKTTLMNIMAAYKVSNVEGKIYSNGELRSVRRFRKNTSYIMQEDHHLPHLTVAECMNVSASLKFGRNLKSAEKQKIISEVLETLSLTECENTRAGQLSGGQRKRLSIAVELMNNPPVMFFDEPTSGLDSQNSFQCISLLKALAMEGRTIICTIHQPSARLFETFDYLFALSEGRCIYKGAVKWLLTFLSSLALECPSYHNPADYLLEVVASGEHTEKLCNAVLSGKCNNLVIEDDKPDFSTIEGNDKKNMPSPTVAKINSYNDALSDTKTYKEIDPFIQQPDKNTTINMACESDFSSTIINAKVGIYFSSQILQTRRSVDQENCYMTSCYNQFWILLLRNYKSILRNSMLTKLRLVSHLVVGLLCGALYFGVGNESSHVFSNVGFIFCSVLFVIFAGMLPTLLTFPLEMKVFLREHHNSWYSLKAYYLAKTCADIPFQLFYPILFLLIIYFMTNQPLEASRFMMFSFICILTSFVAQSMALVIGAAMEIQEATFFAPVLMIPILLFSGFFVSFSTIPPYLRWLTYVSYMRYSFEGSLLSIYGFNRERMDCSLPYCFLSSPDKLLKQFDITSNSDFFWIDCLALSLFFLVFRIGAYFVLRWKLKSQR